MAQGRERRSVVLDGGTAGKIQALLGELHLGASPDHRVRIDAAIDVLSRHDPAPILVLPRGVQPGHVMALDGIAEKVALDTDSFGTGPAGRAELMMWAEIAYRKFNGRDSGATRAALLRVGSCAVRLVAALDAAQAEPAAQAPVAAVAS